MESRLATGVSDARGADRMVAAERLRCLFQFFAVTQCRGRSLVYETLSQGVAEDDALLDLLMRTPSEQRRPSLLFAAVNLLLASHPGRGASGQESSLVRGEDSAMSVPAGGGGTGRRGVGAGRDAGPCPDPVLVDAPILSWWAAKPYTAQPGTAAPPTQRIPGPVGRPSCAPSVRATVMIVRRVRRVDYDVLG